MTLTYSIDRDRCVLFVQIDGVVTANQVLHLFREIASDTRLAPGLAYLGDYSQADFSQISPPALYGLAGVAQRLATRFSALGSRAVKQALVVTAANRLRVAQLHAEVAVGRIYQKQCFTDLAAACDWLGLPVGWPLPPEQVLEA